MQNSIEKALKSWMVGIRDPDQGVDDITPYENGIRVYLKKPLSKEDATSIRTYFGIDVEVDTGLVTVIDGAVPRKKNRSWIFIPERTIRAPWLFVTKRTLWVGASIFILWACLCFFYQLRVMWTGGA